MKDPFEKASDEEIQRRVRALELESQAMTAEDEDVINRLEVEPILSDEDVAEAVDFSALTASEPPPTGEHVFVFADFLEEVERFYKEAYGHYPPFTKDPVLQHEAQRWYESEYAARRTANFSGESGYLALREHLVSFEASLGKGIQEPKGDVQVVVSTSFTPTEKLIIRHDDPPTAEPFPLVREDAAQD